MTTTPTWKRGVGARFLGGRPPPTLGRAFWEEEDDNDKDELESPPTPANADLLHQGGPQYQSVEIYKAKKRLIVRYEEVSGGIKADISPDPLPLPQEMKKQKNNYESWFAGHYPLPLQDGESYYTNKNGCATAFTTRS